ncbi:MAG: hypothetical protein ACRCVI_02275 [Mycoplasmoidaceae bacterium]
MTKYKLNMNKKLIIGLFAGCLLTTSILAPIAINYQNNSLNSKEEHGENILIQKEDIDFQSININDIFDDTFTTEFYTQNKSSSNNDYNFEEKLYVTPENKTLIENRMNDALNHIKQYGVDERFYNDFLEVKDVKREFYNINFDDNFDKSFKNSRSNNYFLKAQIDNDVKQLLIKLKAWKGVTTTIGAIAGVTAAGLWFAAWLTGGATGFLASACTGISVIAGIASYIISEKLERIENRISHLNDHMMLITFSNIADIILTMGEFRGWSNIFRPVAKAFSFIGTFLDICDSIVSWMDLAAELNK